VPRVVRTYDVVMTHKLDADDFFIHRVQQHCAERGLNLFLIEPLWVERFLELFERGEVWARVLLNMHSEHHDATDIYHRLIRLAHERNTRVVDPPDVALAAFDKARLHPRLVEAGLSVPPSIIVPREQVEGLVLSEADLALLGSPFIVKPALGYGRRGLVLDATGPADVARSAATWPDTQYLLQRRILPRALKGEPAYFRVYSVFGSIWCCWWNCYTDRYRMMLEEEEESLRLTPLREIVSKVAALTGMSFFSSEVALTEAGEFVLIDYVNDQCHMLSQSSNPQMGVPDALVAAIAKRLVEGAAGLLTTRR
jgi:hypothetical protein